MKKYPLITFYLFFVPLLSAISASSGEAVQTQTQDCHRQPTSEAIYQQWYDAIRQGDTELAKRLYNQYQINANIPDPRDPKKYPPILIAVVTNNKELTELFCRDRTIDLAANDLQGRTIVHWAAIKNNLHILQMIGPRCTPELLNLTDHDGYTALRYAEHKNHQEIVNFLRAHRNRDISTPRVPDTTSNSHHPARAMQISHAEPQTIFPNNQPVPLTQLPSLRFQRSPRLAQAFLFSIFAGLATYNRRLASIISLLMIGACILGYSNFLPPLIF
ncbi:MAG: ankyrin repeat domain-containing protein [Puniceicoccales bacterium]|jgi:hypothetical protein|nr:ankyrin repeat domain-containing protein [Puniceicoccales bacterium]